MVVLDALCCHPSCPSLQGHSPDIPKRLFCHLALTGGASEWTEDNHLIPFRKHLYNLPSICAPNIIAHKCYAFTQAVKAEFLPLICFLLDHCAEEYTQYAQEALWHMAAQGYESVVELVLTRDNINVNQEDVEENTPLSLAVHHCHQQCTTVISSAPLSSAVHHCH
jgi:hypothetical protein